MPTRVLLQLTACLTVDGEDECRVFKPHQGLSCKYCTSTHDVLLYLDITAKTHASTTRQKSSDSHSHSNSNSSDVFCPRSCRLVSFSQEGDFHTPATDDQTDPARHYLQLLHTRHTLPSHWLIIYFSFLLTSDDIDLHQPACWSPK